MGQLAAILYIFAHSVFGFPPTSGAGSFQKRRCPQELVSCPECLVINWTECLCHGPRKDKAFLNPRQKITNLKCYLG